CENYAVLVWRFCRTLRGRRYAGRRHCRVRTDRPFAMIDLYGTPYSKDLHIVERYRLIDYEEAKDGLERDRKENMQVQGLMDRNYRGKYLQVLYTVDDPGVFTTVWSATVTFGRGNPEWPETVCAENFH